MPVRESAEDPFRDKESFLETNRRRNRLDSGEDIVVEVGRYRSQESDSELGDS